MCFGEGIILAWNLKCEKAWFKFHGIFSCTYQLSGGDKAVVVQGILHLFWPSPLAGLASSPSRVCASIHGVKSFPGSMVIKHSLSLPQQSTLIQWIQGSPLGLHNWENSFLSIAVLWSVPQLKLLCVVMVNVRKFWVGSLCFLLVWLIIHSSLLVRKYS